MKQRIITGAALLAIFIPIVILKPLFMVFQIAMIAMVVVGSLELISMYDKQKKFSKVPMALTVIAAILTYLTAVIAWSSDTILPGLTPIDIKVNFVAISMVVVFMMFGLIVFYDDYDGSDIGKSITIIYYMGLGAAAISILRLIGVRFIVYLFLVTIATDMFAYFFGMRFGKHKMSPKISPKKSWEGAIAGTLIATILGTVFALFYGDIFTMKFLNDPFQQTLLQNFSSLGYEPLWIQALVFIPITMVASILGQIGDLVASRLKRTYSIKDFGKVFPGHGGVLDRFDSAIFVALFLVAVFMAINALFPLVSAVFI